MNCETEVAPIEMRSLSEGSRKYLWTKSRWEEV